MNDRIVEDLGGLLEVRIGQGRLHGAVIPPLGRMHAGRTSRAPSRR